MTEIFYSIVYKPFREYPKFFIQDFFFYFFNILILIKDTNIVSTEVGPALFNVCGKSFIYIRKRSGPKTDPCGTPELISSASEKISSNFLFDKYDWNHLMTDTLKPIHSIFCKSTMWSKVPTTFCRSTGIILVENS